MKLKVGAIIMLIFNVNIADGLTNGSVGKVVDIVAETDDSGNALVSCVIVSFDDPSIGKLQQEKYPVYSTKYKHVNGVPIFRETLEYFLPTRGRSKKVHGVMGKICQFPLQLAWASTAHKVQGSTIPAGKDLVCHGHRNLPPHMLYVMMSRSSSIENLFLDDNVDTTKVVCKSECVQLAENHKLNIRAIENSGNDESTIVLLNVRSLAKHIDDIIFDPVLQQTECIAVTETWMTDDLIDMYDVSDRTKYHSSHGRGKGCAMFVTKAKKSELVGKFSTENYQILSITYYGKFQIILVYLQKGQKNNKEIIDALTLLWKSNYYQIVIGDFNFDANEASALRLFLESRGLEQKVTEPTHLEGRILDHCYISPKIQDFKLEVYSPYYTDHCGLKIYL